MWLCQRLDFDAALCSDCPELASVLAEDSGAAVQWLMSKYEVDRSASAVLLFDK